LIKFVKYSVLKDTQDAKNYPLKKTNIFQI